MDKEVRVFVEHRMADLEFRIIVYERCPDGRIMAMAPAEFREQSRTIRPPGDAGVGLPRTAAQELLESLWREGLRPKNYRDTEPIVAAKDEHIGDLRRIAFHALEIYESG